MWVYVSKNLQDPRYRHAFIQQWLNLKLLTLFHLNPFNIFPHFTCFTLRKALSAAFLLEMLHKHWSFFIWKTLCNSFLLLPVQPTSSFSGNCNRYNYDNKIVRYFSTKDISQCCKQQGHFVNVTVQIDIDIKWIFLSNQRLKYKLYVT